MKFMSVGDMSLTTQERLSIHADGEMMVYSLGHMQFQASDLEGVTIQAPTINLKGTVLINGKPLS